LSNPTYLLWKSDVLYLRNCLLVYNFPDWANYLQGWCLQEFTACKQSFSHHAGLWMPMAGIASTGGV